MARKVRFHPSTMPISGGEPMDGDMAPDDRNYSHEDVDEDAFDGSQSERRPPADDRLTRMEAEIERLREANSLLQRSIPPTEPLRNETMDPVDEMSDEDFDALLFSNPREALRLNNERVKKELRTEYTTNQGTKSFWDKFYDANADLKDDDDLVQSTLNKNMGELGNMAVDKALIRLAELTRDRILGFMKKRKDPRQSRAIVEGGHAPSAPSRSDAEDDDKPETTMGDLLKSRRAARRKAALAA